MPNGFAETGRLAMTPPMEGPRQQLLSAGFDTSLLKFDRADTDRFVLTQFFVPVYMGVIFESGTAPPPGVVGAGSLNEVITQVDQPLGLMFLDRTRIRPARSVLGEELLSLSLAPEEQVVLEQKTFSQRETTFEDQNETAAQTSVELDSSLTTALEVALNQQQQHSTTTSAGVSASLSGTIYGIKIGVSPSYSTSVSDADTTSRSTSLNQTSTASQKITSSYRSVHKTTIRVSTEQQFTSSSQRTLRNPNKYTPIDLRFFKIYQEMRLSHERYGIRLVWCPTITSPGAATLARATAAYQQVIAEATASVSLPAPPVAPPAVGSQAELSPTDTEKGDAIGGLSKNITLQVQPPAGGQGWVWDQNVGYIDSTKTIVTVDMKDPAPTFRLNGAPWVDSSGAVNVPLHLGWSGNGPFQGGGEATVQVQAMFLPNASVTGATQTYLQQLAAYNAQVATLLAQAQSGAEKAAQAAKDAVISGTDVLTECLRQVVAADIPPDLRDSVDSLEVWRALFDWDMAAFTLYQGWWNGTIADPTRSADDFVNAAGARLYLPVRVGLEMAGGQLVLDATKAKVDLDAMVEEITEFRTQHFGDPSEVATTQSPDGGCPVVDDHHICLGTWTELLPTEGTHLEVVQASTAATDDASQGVLSDSSGLRKAQVGLVSEETALQKAIARRVPGSPLSVSVGVRTSERLAGWPETLPDAAGSATSASPASP